MTKKLLMRVTWSGVDRNGEVRARAAVVCEEHEKELLEALLLTGNFARSYATGDGRCDQCGDDARARVQSFYLAWLANDPAPLVITVSPGGVRHTLTSADLGAVLHMTGFAAANPTDSAATP